MSQNLTLRYEVNEALADRVAQLAIGPMPQRHPDTTATLVKYLLVVVGGVAIMVVTGIQWNIQWQLILPLPVMGIAFVFPFGMWGLLHLLRLVAYRRVRRALLAPFHGLDHRRVAWAFTDRGFTFESARRTVRAEWPDLAELFVTRAYQTIRLRTGEDVSIPGPVLTAEVGELIRRKAMVYGAKDPTGRKIRVTNCLRVAKLTLSQFPPGGPRHVPHTAWHLGRARPGRAVLRFCRRAESRSV